MARSDIERQIALRRLMPLPQQIEALQRQVRALTAAIKSAAISVTDDPDYVRMEALATDIETKAQR